MIVANGLPKSGTHALMAWLSRMGLKRCPGVLHVRSDGDLMVEGALSIPTLSVMPDSTFIQGHVPFGHNLTGFSVVTILRDPRNVLISYIRHRAASWGGGKRYTVAEALEDFWGQPFVPAYESYLGWQGHSVILRYEEMPSRVIGDGGEIYTPDRPAWDKWIGNTRTGAPSQWLEHWTPSAEEAWQKAGGPALVRLADYGEHVAPPFAELAA